MAVWMVSSDASAPRKGDAPPAVGGEDPEGDQAEVVGLAGEAGEQEGWPGPAVPVAGERDEPSADEDGREVLVRHGGPAGGPPVAEVAQVGRDDVRERRVDQHHSEQPAEGGVRVGAAERV
jgi:hypothetical protein